MKKKRTRLLLIFTLIISPLLLIGVALSCGIIGIFYNYATYVDDVEGITALQAWDIAEPIANNWDPDGYLFRVAGERLHHNDDGTGPFWRFEYYGRNLNQSVRIVVDTKSGRIENTHNGFPTSAIVNWTMDSPEVVTIAMAHPNYTTIKDEYRDIHVSGIVLVNNGGTNIWSVDFDAGTIGHYKGLDIHIDDATGTVLW